MKRKIKIGFLAAALFAASAVAGWAQWNNCGAGFCSVAPTAAPVACANNMNFGQACSLGFLGALF